MVYDCADDFIDARVRKHASPKDRMSWSIGVAFTLLSISIFLYNTDHGIGVFVDSTRYMGISEWPYDAPLYPWLLQLSATMGLEPDHGAKAIGFVLVGANTALIWHLLMRATDKIACAVIGTSLVILSPQFTTLHSSAMSEPPFLFLLLATIFAFLNFLESERRIWLIGAALALGLATLTRFTAPPLGAAIAICLLSNPRRCKGARVGDVAILTAISATIFLAWAAVSQVVAGRSIGRELWFYGNMGATEWLSSLEALLAWLLPDQVPFMARVLVFITFFVAAVFMTYIHGRETLRLARRTKVVEALLPATLGLFFIFYIIFMILSTSIEANLSLNGRYAFPAYVLMVIMITIVLSDFSRAKGTVRILHHGLVGLALIVIASHSIRTTVRSYQAHQSGVGFASREWRASPTMETIRKLPTDAMIYSNGADAIAYVLKRPANFVPERVQLRTGRENPAHPFEQQLQTMRQSVMQKPSYIVIFDSLPWRFYLADEPELMQHLPLLKIADKPDGRIYAVSFDSQEK